MQTPPNLNDQHAWGGKPFRHSILHSDHSDSSEAVLEKDHQTVSSAVPEQDQTIIGRVPQDNAQVNPMSQAGFVASSSDNLFHPVTNVPSSHVFSLPNIPSNVQVPSNSRRHGHNSNTYHHPYHSQIGRAHV